MGAAAAAIVIKREKDLIEHFRRSGATSPQTAQSSDALGVEEDFIWRRLVDAAVIRPGTNAGAYYFDELTWEAIGRRRRRMALVVGIAALILAFVFYNITVRSLH